MKIQNLYFGVTRWNSMHNQLETFNVFQSSKVRWAVARYVLNDYMLPDYLSDSDPLRFLFSSLHGRVQWEMSVSGLFDGSPSVKTDVYQMFIEPNRNHLIELVNQVSKNSARLYLREERKRLRGRL